MSAILNERIKMTDLDEMRKRYGTRPDVCRNCGTEYLSNTAYVCWHCGTVQLPDPTVLALCDEVETLRAQVLDLESQLADRNARLYDMAHPEDTDHPSADDAPHTDDPFWLPDDL